MHDARTTDEVAELASELAQAHSDVEKWRSELRHAMNRRADLARELYQFRVYPCSRIGRDLGVSERTVWTWFKHEAADK